MYRSIIRNALLLVFLLMLASCAQGDFEPVRFAEAPAAAADAAPAPQAATPGYAPQVAAGGQFIDQEQAPAQRLIIQTASVQLETESFDEAVNSLRNIPSAFGGYAQSERLFTAWGGQRRFEITIRVPAIDFENALEQIDAVAPTRSFSVSAEDVTDRFYDMASRLETRLIEEERILALIDQTNTVRELMSLESRLAATRLQIARYQTSLTDLAGQIAYSTIHVHLFDMHEAYEIAAAATFGERIGGAFGSSIDGTIRAIQFVVVVLAGAIIPLAILSPVILLLVLRLRKRAVMPLAESKPAPTQF